MPVEPTEQTTRRFEFKPTDAVARARASASFIRCPACGADHERYLFYKRGARFVQCRSCDLVYVNPPAREVDDYFDLAEDARAEDRDHVRRELDDVIRHACDVYRARHGGSAPARVLVAGRMVDVAAATSGPPVMRVHLTREQTLQLINDADPSPIVAAIGEGVDLVILNQVLEACPRASEVVSKLAQCLAPTAMLAVVFSNAGSLPGHLLRRNWSRFFDAKTVYFNSENLRAMLERAGLRQFSQTGLSTSYALTRALDLTLPGTPMASVARRLGLGNATARLPTGTYVSIFERAQASAPDERLSVIMPAFNEADYLQAVLEQLLEMRFVIPHEVILVESNSTDGTREIVKSFEGRDRLRIIYEDRPRGKGAAVRRGLQAATGTIVLIQDADFEYDLDDYDMLLEPIVQRRTSFVLGSRSLGLGDWKVRRFASSRTKALLMNLAQLIFAQTFNILYQQRVTDVNTMFKVFRRECAEHVQFRGDGFNFDIELACLLVRNGYSPMEVPVNYVARGFDEGKKINFITEFFPSFSMFFKCRFRRSLR